MVPQENGKFQSRRVNLADMAEPPSARFVDDPALRYVDPLNGVKLDRFVRNIPCEVSSMALPGLTVDLILWVNTRDAEPAWALLADMERDGSRKDN